MSATHQGSSQHQSSWSEPPWSGWIETTGDALLILEAARRGLIPRVTRRLVDSERKMITSGSVFVFDEDESGIKRWTDGFFWSPSRILGNFLLYRETDKRGAGHRATRPEPEINEFEGSKADGAQLSRPKSDANNGAVDKMRERTLMGSLTNSYKFKQDGLMKKTFSLTIGGVAQHLISYYKIEDVESGRLRSPSSLPELSSLDISPAYLDKTHFRNPPKVEIGADGIPRYRGEADDIETSSSHLAAPLSSSGMPLLTDARQQDRSSKRGARFDPYSSPNATKRRRPTLKSSQSDHPVSPTEDPISPQESTSSTTPQQSTTSLPATGSTPPQSHAQTQNQPQAPAYPESHLPGLPGPPPAPYPPYTVPQYFSGYAPPPGHIYAPPMVSYTTSGNSSPQIPQQSSAGTSAGPPPPPPMSYTYPGFPPPHLSDPSQAGQAALPYYPYYPHHPPSHPHSHAQPPPPPPPPGYAGYQPWSPYASFGPPQQHIAHQVPVGYPRPQNTGGPPQQQDPQSSKSRMEDGEDGGEDT